MRSSTSRQHRDDVDISTKAVPWVTEEGRKTLMAFSGIFSSSLPKSHFLRANSFCGKRHTTTPHRARTFRVRPMGSSVGSFMMAPTLLITSVAQAVSINSVLFVIAIAIKQRVLTNVGLLHALGLGVLLWSCLSWQGYSLCFSFLILGSLVTKIGKAEKEALGIAEKREGARGPENLWGAAGVAAICAVLALVCRLLVQSSPNAMYEQLYKLLLVGYTASLATKMSDTTSSEIGKAYGSVTYLVTTLQVVPKGTEGAVSLEGTAAGLITSLLAALYSLAVGLLSGWQDVVIVVIAAFVATTAESFIGAAVQEDYEWSNEFVNFVNTAIGALVAMVLGWCLLTL